MSDLNWAMKACGVFLLWSAAGGGVLAQTTANAPPAPTYTVLRKFDFTDGAYPYAGLLQGTDGKLYGTTSGGGCGVGGEGDGCGTVFKITPSGKLTSLYTFCSQGGSQCTDGLFPYAGLVQGADGKFYGTTSNGGGGYDDDNGTVFSITATGTLTTLYTFCLQGGEYCPDGAGPFAGLVQDSDGSLYGTTGRGGANGALDAGTVFKITPSGKLTTLYSFCSQLKNDQCSDGLGPIAGLVLGTDGKFYGTTIQGGVNGNAGTIFSITAGGVLTTLYSFPDSCADGCYPRGGLVQGTDGDFYGTTYSGGGVFKMTPSGKFNVLYYFCSEGGDKCTDGEEPEAALIQGTDGNFYGTTSSGGTKGLGTIFQVTRKGKLTTLYDFCSPTCSNGALPMGAVTQDTNGIFYGTAWSGGALPDGYGVVYSLSVGLCPFVKTEPAYGKVGSAVKILGTDLSSVTNVRFDGIEAKFTIVSASEITATVPKGATTGPVRVITPAGKLQSNVPFRAKP
jgi:uncharacterized repeat protein (TIGR03803 family)